MGNIIENIHYARFAAQLGEHAQALEICVTALAQVNAMPPSPHKPQITSRLFRIINKLRAQARKSGAR